jgi:hypothetical protein
MMKYDPKGMSDLSYSSRSILQADGGSQAACAVYRGQDQIDVCWRKNKSLLRPSLLVILGPLAMSRIAQNLYTMHTHHQDGRDIGKLSGQVDKLEM